MMNTLPRSQIGFMPRFFAIVFIGLLFVSACSSTSQTGPVYEGDYRDRSQSQQENAIREESKEIFGAPLYRRGVQPVWLKIENNRDEIVSFLPVGLDPAYFTPIDTAQSIINVKQFCSFNGRTF